MRNFWWPTLLVVTLTLAAGCAHDPGNTGTGAPISKFQETLQKNELIVGMTGRQVPGTLRYRQPANYPDLPQRDG